MDVEIVERKANPLLHRNELRFTVTHPTAPTPKREEVREALAKLAQVSKDRLVIEWMHAKFGTAESEGEAAAYDSKEALESVVREHVLVRNKFKEKAPKGAAPAAPAPEAPSPPAEPAKEAE
jgi:small subunit ribosomal protein S24e